ncbi:MAG: MATE family efflux transporter [Acidobacteria bacterium]|nr:MAG: MATE family efflux transporter [Acidobacteriota bacterium]
MKDLTRGSVTKHVLAMSSFIGVSMVFQTMYYLVDLYFVSRLGKEAIAGVGLAGNLMLVVLALTQMLGVGTTALISHAAGRKDQPRAQFVFNQSFVLSLIVGAGVVVLGFLLRPAYCRWLGADPGTARAASNYLLFFIPALGAQFALVSMAAALRGTGIVRPTMIVQVFTVLVNLVLAPVLIAGWGTHHPLGVIGASLATLIALGVAVALIAAYFLKLETFVSFDRSQWRPDPKTWKAMLNIGLPAGGEFGLMGVYVAVVYGIIRHFGAAAQAGFGIGGRVMQSIFLPVLAISFAASPVAGQNFGARLGDRVRQTFFSAAAIGTGVMLLLTALCHLSPESLIRLFSPEAEVIAFGADYLRIISWNFVAMGLIFTSSAMFQAMGNSWPPLAASSLRLFIFALPAALLSLRPGFAIRQVWYLSVATVTLQVVVNLTLLNREFQRKLVFEAPPVLTPVSDPEI